MGRTQVARVSRGRSIVADGFIETRDIVIGLLAEYSPTSSLTLSAGLGYDMFRKLRFFSPDGQDLSDYEVKGALSARFLMAFRF